jgi:hypothetical protein
MVWIHMWIHTLIRDVSDLEGLGDHLVGKSLRSENPANGIGGCGPVLHVEACGTLDALIELGASCSGHYSSFITNTSRFQRRRSSTTEFR